MKKLAVLFTVVVLAACSSPEKSEEKAPAKHKPALSEAWEWPEGSGAARDLAKDDADCRGSAPEDVPPLVGVKVYVDCMVKKGWKLVQPPKKTQDG